MFRCPGCHSSLDEAQLRTTSRCSSCQLSIEAVEGVPLLVKDRQVIEANIEESRRLGHGEWYAKPQGGQWTGPYRHHVKKRKDWVEGAIAAQSVRRGAGPVIGLDLGCGDGSNLYWLRPHVSVLYGSDYNVLRLLRASKLGADARLFMADICNYPAEDDSFDVIYFNHVLEHIPDDAVALREVRRILKPGGLAVLGVPNEGAAFWQLAYRLEPKTLATSDHQNFYTADMLAERCRAAGLTVQTVHPIGWGVPHWTLDAVIRRFKWVDDGLEMLGSRFFPGQASSLYALLTK